MSKNTRNRILLTALAALLLVTLTIGGTIAWLTDDTEKITNTFTTSKVDVDLGEEHKGPFQMVPGATITKDPKITVATDSEDCWVFVKVEESDVLDDYISYTMAANWEAVDGYPGVYRYAAVQKAGAKLQVLANDSVTVNAGVTTKMMEDLDVDGATQPTLSFTAFAVQSANLTTTDAKEIYEIALAKGVVTE